MSVIRFDSRHPRNVWIYKVKFRFGSLYSVIQWVRDDSKALWTHKINTLVLGATTRKGLPVKIDVPFRLA